MSEVSERYDLNLPFLRTVCLPKRVIFAYFTYAPLIAFIFSIITLPGHIILFPYYVVVYFGRGRPAKTLYLWVYFNSALLYGAIHDKDEVWRDFGSMYYVYFGYIVAFVNWILLVTSLCLIFPIFIFIEEWQLLTNVMYRITFGNWKKLVNECPEMRYKRSMKQKQTKSEKIRTAKAKGKMHDVKVEIVDDKKTKGITVCSTCGEEIDKDTSYCPKCGSYVGH